MNNDPYWYKLIWHWVKKERRNGLTIPFIIGSVKFSGEAIEIDNVLSLFDKIKNSDSSEIITLLYCPDIGEYVLGIDNPYYPMKGIEIKNEISQRTTFKATISTEVLGKSLVDIAKSLQKKYTDCLREGKYSLKNIGWDEYSESDIILIRDIIND